MEHVTTQNFEEIVLQSKKPVVVDFWAVWCGPCQMMAPVLEELDKERPDLAVCKVNVDEEPDLAMRYRVVSIPTILLFQGGQKVAQSIGYMPKEDLVRSLGI